MRRVLVLGGTGWLGRAVAEAALRDGAEVTCLARGESGEPPACARFVRADRSADDAYSGVGEVWDDVVELATDPAHVAGALEALSARAAHWTFVSTISVYARTDRAGDDEDAPVVEPVEPVDPTPYADAKVTGERATRRARGTDALVVRPGLIVGPGDPSDRFGYWAARLDRGGDVVTPVLEGRAVQVVDVTDLAEWIVRAGRAGTVGTVDAVRPSTSMGAFLDEVRAATGFDGRLVAVDDDTLLAQGVAYWAGPASLPLWIPAGEVGFARRAGLAFLAAGGTTRPLAETVRRVVEDERARGVGRVRRSGVTDAEERRVLDVVRPG
ncbi:NAD-dependent epimerase/dehydratase family protein [Curtobacterium sp. MCLR17_032]|uniref:NAD-dependent epimerase/dehydratase family protein n=1 Tax=Curtobacterium sp. MCLR17_032 TaxID=2175650 RepID=UPI000DA749EE|nr:NAD-dependent epimerase/dehydratase family protein [Curtobacterium sp. MCLR17_032]WIE60120.1 NAD-dependent epimerase/dehydratase family protein [Curtobacterium sp. MCLR17_032]